MVVEFTTVTVVLALTDIVAIAPEQGMKTLTA